MSFAESQFSQYVSARTRTQLLILFLALSACLYLLTLLLDAYQLVILPGSVASDIASLEGEDAWPNALRGLTLLLELLVLVITAVLFFIWLHRVNKNLRPLGALYVEFTPGWAVGWFFIPFANLVMPYRVVKEVWTKSAPDVSSTSEAFRPTDSASLVGWWWGVWLISNVLLRVAAALSESKSADTLFLSLKVDMFASAFRIAAAALAIMVVHGIYKRQEERSKQTVVNAPPIFTTQN